ncbi:major facilitator superfamily transporter [Xylariomycetidae sp. FL2044]|nr:major facilitator superfamily transporter [Xylariomycetidae sp. FL2044]
MEKPIEKTDQPQAAEPLDGGGDLKSPSIEVGENVVELAASFTPEEEKRLLRKIDSTILPIMCLVFFFQYLDKQSLSYAGVFGLISDLNMTSVQYSWCSSIFYVGQLVAEYPFIYLMSKLHLTKFVGATVVIWGIICMCLAAPKSFAGFAAVRFLLGFAEGAVSPSFVTITSIWYQKNEHASRTGLWITMNSLAQIVGCMLMYGIGKNNNLALADWRVLFIVCGALTSTMGAVFYFLMPNGPKDAWFLSPREKEVLSLRMAKDREGGDKTSFSMRQLRESVKDVKTWFVFAFGVLITIESPVLTFASLVINSIGYDKFETMLYTAPSGAVQIAMLWVGVGACWLFPNNRTWVVLGLFIPPVVGTALLLRLDLSAGWAVIGSSWLASCLSAIMSPLLSLTASNVKGNTKRSIVSCVFFIGYCAGCIAGPQLWTEKPRYFSGLVTTLTAFGLLGVTTIAYRIICVRDNARRDHLASNGQIADDQTTVVLDKYGAPMTDLTDKEDLHFRYSV